MKKSRQASPFLLQDLARWASGAIRRDAVPLSTAMIVGILAHLFAFTNKLVNYDDIQCLFSKGGTYHFGRWGLCFMDSIFPNYSMPWIYGIITIVLLSISACVIIHVFKIQSKLLQALVAGSVVVFPSLTATMTFMFTVSSYAVSFLLAVLAVWVLQQDWKWKFIPAIMCLGASLSIYQAYLAITSSMLVLLLIQEMLQGKDVLPAIRKGIMYVIFLAITMILYFIATMLVEKIVGYDGSLSNSEVSLMALPERIVLAYTWFFRILFEGKDGLIPTTYSRILHLLCLGSTFALLLLWAMSQKKKGLGQILLAAALILLLPMTSNCMILLGGEESVHTLVLYGFISLYLLPCICAEHCLRADIWKQARAVWHRVSLNIMSISIALIIFFNIYLSNEVYLNLYLRYENSHAFYNALVANIQLTPEFDKHSKLAVIGYYNWPSYFIHPTDNIMGASGFVPDEYPKEKFLEYYLGYEIPFASEEEIAQISESPEFEEMARYPYYGSIRKIGDTVVVKLS